MSPELADVVHVVIEEALGRVVAGRDPARRYEPIGDVSAELREHFLDRWYRFAAFGVTSRDDLQGLRVTTEMGPGNPPPGWGAEGTVLTSRTTVSLKGTALEGK